MARIKYRDINFKPDTLARIVQMNRILSEYKGRVSVRQLYYRLVSAGLIPNEPQEYDKVQAILTNARYAGLIDWDAIEDRNREPLKARDWPTGRAALDETVEAFRLDRWLGQPFYVELWVEKAALAGVLAPIGNDYHVTLMVNRGYSSASAMKESAARVIYHNKPTAAAPHGRRPVILYIGDHDPSGEDMVRDIRDRLLEFGCPSWLDVRKVALTMEQIEAHDPPLPPNPAKMKDVRAKGYVEKHGEFSWEVDSLPPPELDLLVRTTINAYIDKPTMEKVIAREAIIKTQIKTFAASFKEP